MSHELLTVPSNLLYAGSDELIERLVTLASRSHDLRFGRNGTGTPGADCSDYCPACKALGGRNVVEAMAR
ncbi:hypothetical protein BBK14_33425 [Parafrankia soli]|uniref:Uncharacterized protein n=1 Tax=Parafrankia soli TaxID=2599596 RepID=A0A1S1QQM3_9ACTN|nr:hypothetical protein [Parafrankia soli]OHV35392.1 hypothetical protein BBK14_33425 [Parafrankia soli]